MAQRSFKTPEGVKVSIFEEPGKLPVLHSLDGPAMKYPKSMKKEDEYYIYGKKYTKDEWLDRINDAKVTYIPVDPELN